jgi:hypothetical protein
LASTPFTGACFLALFCTWCFTLARRGSQRALWFAAAALAGLLFLAILVAPLACSLPSGTLRTMLRALGVHACDAAQEPLLPARPGWRWMSHRTGLGHGCQRWGLNLDRAAAWQLAVVFTVARHAGCSQSA